MENNNNNCIMEKVIKEKSNLSYFLWITIFYNNFLYQTFMNRGIQQ